MKIPQCNTQQKQKIVTLLLERVCFIILFNHEGSLAPARENHVEVKIRCRKAEQLQYRMSLFPLLVMEKSRLQHPVVTSDRAFQTPAGHFTPTLCGLPSPCHRKRYIRWLTWQDGIPRENAWRRKEKSKTHDRQTGKRQKHKEERRQEDCQSSLNSHQFSPI